MTEQLNLEQMPQALSYLIKKVESIEAQIAKIAIPQPSSTHNEWMTIKDLCAYLPTHPARQTVYEWVRDKIIPHHKTSKMLTFNKKEIDNWLHGSYRKTVNEIEKDAENFMKSINGKHGWKR